MSGQQHHFLPGLTNNQQTMRNQFGGSMQNQLGNSMQNQLNNQLSSQMPVQMGNQIPPQLANTMASNMMSQMGNTMGNQMTPQMANTMVSQIGNTMGNPMSMGNGNQMMGQINQQYNINAHPAQMQQQNANTMQMTQQALGMQHHAMQQQVMQNANTVVPAPTPPVQAQTQQSKELNTASLCRIGQETVQDIVSRTQEVFQTLKAIQPPNGTPQGLNSSNEKKVKVQEQLRTIRVLFKRLRLIYEKSNENCQIQGMEYTHIESLIPYKDEIDPKHDEKKNTEAYRLACDESKEVMEQVVLKNKQLKEIIDHLRRVISEINTMLTMRRS